MARTDNAASARLGQRNYRIRVAGRLNREWSDRLQGMEVTTYGSERGAVSSELSGPLPDQAALMGVLQHLYSCGVTIMGMECVGSTRSAANANAARPPAGLPSPDKERRKITGTADLTADTVRKKASGDKESKGGRTMKRFARTMMSLVMGAAIAVPAAAYDEPKTEAPAQAAAKPAQVLFQNVNVFDGQNEKLIQKANVLVEGNLIKKISTSAIATDGATVVDGGGRTLMPGLTDVHWHVMFNSPSIPMLMTADMGYLTLLGAKSAEEDLMRGFTTVRDVGGNPFGIKKAIDEGMIPGPRIYPSGPMISQTSGHSDNRGPNEPDVPIYLEKIHLLAVADGVPDVVTAVRRNLRMGATQIKISAGGGVSSNYDPLDVSQYTIDEMKAAVEVAKTWNTYVAIHANTDAAIQMSLNAGVLSVEHGFLMSEDTVKLMAEKDAWFSMEPMLNDEDAIQFPPGSDNQRKWIQVTDGTDKVIGLAKKHKVKIAFGSDILFDAAMGQKHGKLLAKLKRWFTPYEALKMATSGNAELIKLCGPRDPYPGELGVVKEGALADLILVNGDPLENLDLVADPDKNFAVIMKDGKIYKNTVK